jgi:hypothetical protein
VPLPAHLRPTPAPPDEDDGIRHAAFQVAGYAVFAVLHGLEIDRIRVYRDDQDRVIQDFGYTGRRLVDGRWVDDGDDVSMAAELLLTAMGGGAALDNHMYGPPPDDGSPDEDMALALDDEDDLDRIKTFASLIDPYRPDAVVGRAWKLVANYIRLLAVPRAIDALAGRLQDDVELDGPEASAVVHYALGAYRTSLLDLRNARLDYVRGSGTWPPKEPDKDQEDAAFWRLMGKVGHHGLVVWAVLCEDTYETAVDWGFDYTEVAGVYLWERAARAAIPGLSDAQGQDADLYAWHVRSYTLTRSGNTLTIAPEPTRREPTTPKDLATAMAKAGLL